MSWKKTLHKLYRVRSLTFLAYLIALWSSIQRSKKQIQINLTKGLEELLDLLDCLSKEIHKKYEDVSKQIKMLDG